MGKKKRPVLKIVLIVLGAIVIIAVITNIAGGGDSSSSPETTVATTTNVESGEVVAAPEAPPEKKSSPQYVKAGMYKVGSELPAGEYIIEATGDMAYYQVSSDSSGEIDSIIVNDTFNKGVFAYIILQDGDYIKIDRGRMIAAPELTLQPKLDAIPPSTYKVGKDIPAGEYKLTPTDEIAYWERNKNPRDSINGIIANDVVTESVYVTIRDGEYFKITGVQGQKVY
ncbi:MAG: hypothetical protein LBB62_00460 [Proteiniphilum sp.]|jgi:hypothetical protein|nr:hypothetical protein [Proteiniphilum sp.]